MKGPNWKERRLSPWQRRLLTGAATAIAGQLYLSLWAEGFRVSIAAVIYPLLLITLMRESHRPDTGAAAGLCVMALRVPLDLRKGMGLAQALVLEALKTAHREDLIGYGKGCLLRPERTGGNREAAEKKGKKEPARLKMKQAGLRGEKNVSHPKKKAGWAKAKPKPNARKKK